MEIESPVKYEVSDSRSNMNNWRPDTKQKKWLWLAVVVALIGLFWYKTNTWPIVAVVGTRPVTRFEINQTLFKSQGAQAVDNIVTTELVKKALKKEGIEVSNEDVNSKVTEIEQSLGEGGNLDQLLSERGLTVKDFKDQLKLRIGIERASQSKVQVSDEEVTAYVKENGAFLTATTEAEQNNEARIALEQQELQNAIVEWVEQVRAEGKVWRFGVAEVPSL